MSILIKGLKMPREGMSVVAEIWNNGKAYVYWTGNSEMYDAVELPDHGDLIDKDEAADDACLIWGRNSSGDDATQEIIEHLRKMKAVIPAERSEE